MSRRRLILYGIVAISVILIRIAVDRDTLEKGDRVSIVNQTFGARHYSTLQELESLAYHEDKVGVLQYIYDEEARFLSPGAQGRVIMDGSSWVEVRFDDDPLKNWWVKKEAIKKI